MKDAVLYLAGLGDGEVIKAVPCMMCRRMILNAGLCVVVSTDGEGGILYTTMDYLKRQENEGYEKKQ
jgi:deoxycytidylate deaminase